ncbi:PDR/VanB family oxidoreductase [Paraglaciecola sp.]|uniref:PDR/VanB family oxidoreductase n=1 Tax=Paraglaciecola sp. TaxID=1920173 RepID=UPI00273F4355|nr:PDR/VanB family oxidoreductase [Paraglaciecola sp.]MDP5029212.1 PDR/VanB family oxidoreductase [Paraglaciecola sp.]
MLNLQIRSKTPETANIVSFELERSDQGVLPPYSAGAHIDVQIAPKIVRQYSLLPHPDKEHIYKIAVLKEAQSRGGSQFLHESTQVGDTLTISAPRNLFPLNLDSQKVLLFAGGIGITPLLSMAYELDRAGIDFELHYHVKQQSHIAFYQALKDSTFASKVFFHCGLSPTEKEQVIQQALSTAANKRALYTCGPNGFMDYIFATARALGWLEQHMHKEVFSAKPLDDDRNDGSFELFLTRSNLQLHVPADKSALEVIEDAGVEIDVSCEQGICGSCLTAVSCGQVDHRDQFLSEAEKALHNRFTPCCSRALSPSLTIDL